MAHFTTHHLCEVVLGLTLELRLPPEALDVPARGGWAWQVIEPVDAMASITHACMHARMHARMHTHIHTHVCMTTVHGF